MVQPLLPLFFFSGIFCGGGGGVLRHAEFHEQPNGGASTVDGETANAYPDPDQDQGQCATDGWYSAAKPRPPTCDTCT